MPTCDREVSDLLFLLVNGRLGEADRRRVEEHLTRCAACSERLELLGWMKRQIAVGGEALFQDHVATGALVEFCDQPEALSQEQRAVINEHLELCRSCAAEVETLRAVNEGLESGGESAPVSSDTTPLLPRLRSWLTGLLAGGGEAPRFAPVPAYLLLILLAYPALVGIQQLVQDRFARPPVDLAPIGSVASPVILESAVERGAEEVPVIQPLPDGQATLLLRAPIARAEVLRYDVALIGPGGETVWSQADLESRQEFGVFVLTLKTGALAPGAYRFRLSETHRQTGETVNTFDYPFVVEDRAGP
jgi:anti-sigma factor RsiW